MAERLYELMDHNLASEQIMCGLNFSELCSLRMLQPTMSSHLEMHLKHQKDNIHHRNELVLSKYSYMFENVSYLFSRRYDYIYKGLSLPPTYELQYKPAMGWFQEFIKHFYEDYLNQISPPIEYMINTFIEKWMMIQPEIDKQLLYKELVLSETAMNKMRGASPKFYHLQCMYEMDLTYLERYIVHTLEEYNNEKEIPERLIIHFPVFNL